jgi:serine/threonine-protein kinase
VPPPYAPLTGRILGDRYRVGALLGAGAMGRVYRATHVELGRRCAVKVIRRHGQGSDAIAWSDAIARFRVEALAGARLDHPSVLRVLDFGREPADGLYYLVTEELDGADLCDVLHAARRLDPLRVARIGQRLCAALQHAHERGVIHRDLKPENVRVLSRVGDDGRAFEEVKILDFGTAHIEGEEGDALARAIVGTPAYMSPEQASGCEVDGRSDLYALGVLLFELVTGRLPFERPSIAGLAAAHAALQPPRPSEIAGPLDPELESIILACLEKRPGDRPRDARAVREALDRVIERSDERAPRSRGPSSSSRGSSARRAIAVAAAASALGALALGAGASARAAISTPLAGKIGDVVRRPSDPSPSQKCRTRSPSETSDRGGPRRP